MSVPDSAQILMSNIYRMIKTTLSASSPTLLLFISLLLNPLIRCFAVDRKKRNLSQQVKETADTNVNVWN